MRLSVWMSLILVSLTTPVSGCVSFRGPEELRTSVCGMMDIETDREAAVSVGPLGILMASFFSEEPLPIQHLRHVDIGMYRILKAEYRVQSAARLNRLEMPGWTRLAYLRDLGEEALVLTGTWGQKIRYLTIIMLQYDQLTIVRIEGDIDRLIEDKDGTETFLSAMDRLRVFLSSMSRVGGMVDGAHKSHREHEDALRDELRETGYLNETGGSAQ